MVQRYKVGACRWMHRAWTTKAAAQGVWAGGVVTSIFILVHLKEVYHIHFLGAASKPAEFN